MTDLDQLPCPCCGRELREIETRDKRTGIVIERRMDCGHCLAVAAGAVDTDEDGEVVDG